MTAYQYRPDLIYNIDPSPQYPDGPHPLPEKTALERSKFKDSLEKFRDNQIGKKRQRERMMTGRLFAHLRQEELRQAVQDIHDKETSASGDAAAESLSSAAIKEKGVWVDHFDYDDQFKLPYGVGYDHVIKKRTDMIDKQKFWNNRVMDELVESLGYMDYRDALACNKYIMETKRHGDYHQQARAKILGVAMSRYNAQKRLEIEQKAAAAFAQGKIAAGKDEDAAVVVQQQKDETKLKVIMQEDPEMARLYREAYGDIKAEKEHDYNEAQRIHEKYAYLFDKKNLDNKVPTSRYDLQNERPSPEEEILTTELSDAELDLMYKRYKFIQSENSVDIEDMELEAKQLIQKYSTGEAKSPSNPE